MEEIIQEIKQQESGENRAKRVERLKFRPFIVDSLNGLLNTDSGFLYTLWLLMIKPWKVVRDYIHGERSRYMAPISMLLTILIYSGFFELYFKGDEGHIFQFAIQVAYEVKDTDTFGDKLIHLWDDIISSQQIAYLLLCGPIVCGVFLAYIRNGSRRFNITEYMVAAIYMVCTLLTYDLISMLFDCMGLDIKKIVWAIVAVLCFIMLTKSFRVSHSWLHIPLLLLCILLIALIFFAIVVIGIYASGDSISGFNAGFS